MEDGSWGGDIRTAINPGGECLRGIKLSQLDVIEAI
jgi:hypothetical protein